MINQVFKAKIQEIEGNKRNFYAWVIWTRYLLSVGIRITVLFSGMRILRVNALTDSTHDMVFLLFFCRDCFHGERKRDGGGEA